MRVHEDSNISDCVDLNLRCIHMSEGTFLHVTTPVENRRTNGKKQ